MLTKNMSLVVTRMAGPKSIKELIEQAKARPGTMNMGAGTITSRLGAVLFAKTAGIDVQLIPFKGSAEIGQAVLAGTVDFALDSTGTALPLVQGGQYRALAKYTNQPLPMFPGVPSLSEAAGLPSIDESSTWIAIAAPAGTPRPIVEKIQNAVAKIYADRPTLEQAREGRHQCRQLDVGRAHRVHPQRDRALVAGSQGKQPSLEDGSISHNNNAVITE